ncbi:MAG: hypothetical protein A2114_02205 [Candidatus Vogelbacteria bacterium GWA1_51_14]|uniref:FAD/NAD(P)-binding domain-containing protein n=1 Tax=Candidatus Vogelbacteria bacterium GWA1_51_14 TaxID=1802435 RepID=A0A1G2Q986_9BACT|nr:MAG: hypothetical protein A2114_02205 [Candidatus Vogelbacteria bacterium GWA1_51_14]
MIYDLVIIGGGPAGTAAGVYAARKQLKTKLITPDLGGQSIVSPDIQNWIGTPSISGEALAKQFKTHLEANAGEWLELAVGPKVKSIEKTDDHFAITTDNSDKFETQAVLLAAGAKRRPLEVHGAAEYDQKGLTYCASCDGPLYAGQDVVVVGGGNAGFETAGQLLAYAKSVTLLHRSPEFKADAVTVEKLSKNPKFHALRNAEPTEVKGDKFVTGIAYRDKDSGEIKELPAAGIFVEIGFLPNTEMVKELVELNQYGAVKIDCRNQRTSIDGLWAAGDCTDELFHQNNIAAGDAVKALEDIYNWIQLR